VNTSRSRNAQSARAIESQIARADDLLTLRPAALQVDALVPQLYGEGVPVQTLAALVGTLNRALFARLWALLAPADLMANSCLVVMGSEGRGEQLLRTDQDNALLLRDGFELDGLAALTERFTAALIDFGYPRCPGNIMLSNPQWRQPLAAFKQALGGWIYGAQPEGVLNLAIFLDAAAVAGDAALLSQAHRFVDEFVVDNDAFFARFASAADQFAPPSTGWWSRLVARRGRGDGDDQPGLDLKKLGSFPIVHGVRALALQHHVAELGTVARLHALVQRAQLAAPQAEALAGALHAVMALRLEHQLRQRAGGVPVDNLLRPATLNAAERSRLHDALAVVGRFRQHLRMHFRLDAL
jgi:CBS domain-containing protein